MRPKTPFFAQITADVW